MNLFINTHSTVIINMDHFVRATGEDHAGSPITLTLRDGTRHELHGDDADRFREFCLRHSVEERNARKAELFRRGVR